MFLLNIYIFFYRLKKFVLQILRALSGHKYECTNSLLLLSITSTMLLWSDYTYTCAKDTKFICNVVVFGKTARIQIGRLLPIFIYHFKFFLAHVFWVLHTYFFNIFDIVKYKKRKIYISRKILFNKKLMEGIGNTFFIITSKSLEYHLVNANFKIHIILTNIIN